MVQPLNLLQSTLEGGRERKHCNNYTLDSAMDKYFETDTPDAMNKHNETEGVTTRRVG